MIGSIVWVNGQLLPTDVASVSPFDHGLMVGDGVFETLRVYDGIPFAWTRHYDRLLRSTAGLGLTAPADDALRGAADAVLAGNKLTDGRLRITVTGGPAPLGSERGEVDPTVIVAAAPMRPWPPAVAVVHVPWTRNERSAVAGLKTISYAENVRALAFALEHSAGEAVFCNSRGELCEATGSNIFVVQGGALRTPPEDAGCLPGVTRALLLEECAKAIDVSADETPLAPGALAGADEAFLTSSTREVQPISHVDGVALPAAPGPTTTALAAAFRELVRRNPDP